MLVVSRPRMVDLSDQGPGEPETGLLDPKSALL